MSLFGNCYLQLPPTCTPQPTTFNQLTNKLYVDTQVGNLLINNETFNGAISFAQNITLPTTFTTPTTSQLGYTIQANAPTSTAIPTNTSTILCSLTLPSGKWLCQWSVMYFLATGSTTTLTYTSQGLTNNGVASNFIPTGGNPSTMQSSYASEVLGGTNGLFILRSGSSVIDSTSWGSSTVFLTTLVLYTTNSITTNSASTAGTGFTLTRIA